MKLLKCFLLTFLLIITPGMLHADDDDPVTTIGSGITPPPPPPSPGGEAIVSPPPPKDGDNPKPGNPKMPSKDRIYLYYGDYTLTVAYNLEFEPSEVELHNVQTDAVHILQCTENEQEFYLPLEVGDYNVTITTETNKTYQGLLILE